MSQNTGESKTTPRWAYFPVKLRERECLGDNGQYLNYVIREVGKLGSLGFVVSEETAQKIVEDHNARI